MRRRPAAAPTCRSGAARGGDRRVAAADDPGASATRLALDLRPGVDPLRVVLADRPSVVTAIRVGVVQYEIWLKYSSSSAWNVSQWFLTAVRAHDFWLDGASPNHSATAAFAFGLMMWSIHLYMQLGCLALDAIIHVSDQPVEPSEGSVVLIGTGFFSPWQQVRDHLPRGADVGVALREGRLLLGVVRPVLADVLALLLEQVDRGVELLVVELVRVGDLRARGCGPSGTPPRRRCRSGCRRP